MAEDYIPYSGPVVTRAEAKALGLKRYFTGIECKHGHLSDRRTTDAICGACEPNRRLVRRDERNASAKAWREANPEKVLENRRKWHEENLERERAYSREWRRQNPEKNRANSNSYRASKLSAPGRYTADEIAALNAKQKFKCASCKTSTKKIFHADHIMPLSLGGSNYISNIQILCPSCNSKKQAKHPIVWAQQNGRLL